MMRLSPVSPLYYDRRNGGRKGVGLCPYPYAEGVTSFACKRNFTAATVAISRCRKATFHIPLAEYFTLTERISLYE